jgi:6-phosphogluconolactonase (cycloisomerase 2 family)
MRLILLYRPKSEFAHSCEQYVKEFEHRTAKQIEIVDIDSQEGISLSKLYDVMDHPTFLATADDGRLMQTWPGKRAPLINELSAYAPEKPKP